MRVPAVGDRLNLDDVGVGLGPHVTSIFSERPLLFKLGQDLPLDYDLGSGWDRQIASDTLDDVQRRAA